MIEVAMPAQPQASSSTTRQLSKSESPTPPCSLGIETLASPSSHAFLMISRGNSPLWSYCAACRGDLLLREAPRGLLERELLVVEREVHGVALPPEPPKS